MAEEIPIEFQAKRRLLHGAGMDRRRDEVADALVRQGRLAESLEYLEKTKDPARLSEVRRQAVAAGDVFSLVRACQILREDADANEWRQLASCAERAGRFYDAVNAWERSGDQAKADEVRGRNCPDFKPFKPAGK